MIELNNLKLIAQGGQADIYELDRDKVIRVLRHKEEEDALKSELAIMKSLKEKGKAVPEIYEYLTIEDRPSIIMERLYGDTMLEETKKKPLEIFKQAKKLAELHLEVAGSSEGLEMLSINDRAAYLIPRAEMLDSELISFAMDVLAGLPRGNDICHGDFHPGNIIISNQQYYVIDWFGATSGRKLADVAHTYLLLRNTPKLATKSKFQNFIIGCSARIISRKYIASVRKIYSFDWSEFSKWLVIRAAERVFYGMPSEKAGLIDFINSCREAQKNRVASSIWWKYI